MVAESTVSSRHQRSPCCDIPTIGQLHMWRYTARAQACAVIFQPSDSYTCGAIPLEHRHVSSQLGPGGQWLQQWVGPTAPRRAASGQYARAPRIRPKWNIEILIAMLEVQWRSLDIIIEKMSRWSHKCGARSRSPNYECEQTGFGRSTALFSSARSRMTSRISPWCATLVWSTHGLVSAFFHVGRQFGASRPNTLACGLRKRPRSFLMGVTIVTPNRLPCYYSGNQVMWYVHVDKYR